MPDATEPVTVHNWNATFRLIQTPPGLIVRELTVQADKTVIGTNPFSLEIETPGIWTATIEQAAVQHFLEKKVPAEIKNIQAELLPGRIRVTGSVRMIVELGIEAMCTLAIRDHSQIWIELESVSVAGVGGKALVEKQLEKINPILDIGDLPFSLKLSTVTLIEGEIVVHGTVSP